ncbi:MAG: N-acetylmuramoyl-L-alanine amidase [Chloroflexi bacterium]|nr:N-acetylmuramoyl-L-alanine amidase [Chloroflexota bacterium]
MKSRTSRVFLFATIVLLTGTGMLAYEFFFVQVPKVGIVVGHWRNDSGATCEDGLREVDINMEIAQAVASRLKNVGYRVDLLSEFDTKLHGYHALALVSLHADSCLPGYTGFKVARGVHSIIPAADDALVDCIWDHYENATHLERDPLHVTIDMQEYHAFQTINPKTPSAIIELGYLAEDRELLNKHPGKTASGVVEGIRCFLERSAQRH